jgi:hypothetical protein
MEKRTERRRYEKHTSRLLEPPACQYFGIFSGKGYAKDVQYWQ